MAVAERRQELRASLVDAAERIVAEQGLPALKARDLAAAVGCALGAIYTVFPDLDALVLEVNLRTLAVFEAALSRSAPASPPESSDEAAAELARLGAAYLAFASQHPRRWRALFQHRMAHGQAPPPWYVEQQARLFERIEAPLAALRPDLPEGERALLARTLFSASHGVVSLGLDEKLAALPPAVVATQLDTVIRAMAAGLARHIPGDG